MRLLVIGAQQSHRIGIRGGWKMALTVLAWFVGYCVYRSQIDPAAAYIEANAGFVGGLGGHPILGWIFGGVLAAVIAYIVGKICLGLRTDYLAIATIGISEIIRALIKNMDWLTRGTLTVSPIPWPTPLPQEYQAGGMDGQSALLLARGGFLLLAIVVLGIALWLISRAYAGPWGRMMRAIRDNHIAAASMGKNVTARQLEIFVFGSVLMGIGGAMLVSFVQIFDPSSYQPINHTFIIWVMIIVGGAGNNWGAIFGAVLIWIIWVISEPLATGDFRVGQLLVDQHRLGRHSRDRFPLGADARLRAGTGDHHSAAICAQGADPGSGAARRVRGQRPIRSECGSCRDEVHPQSLPADLIRGPFVTSRE